MGRRSRLSTMVSRPFSRASSQVRSQKPTASEATCRSVMQHANALLNSDSVATVLDNTDQQNWDHVFIVDEKWGAHGKNSCR